MNQIAPHKNKRTIHYHKLEEYFGVSFTLQYFNTMITLPANIF